MACLNPKDNIAARIFDTEGVFHSLRVGSGGGMARDGILTIRKKKDFRRVTESRRNDARASCELACDGTITAAGLFLTNETKQNIQYL